MYGRLPLSKQPNDVLRRKRILNEHLLTKEGTRRLSMSVGGGGGKPEKQKRLSSRELMGQVQSKPKKQRRLSSRELMKEEKNKSTAVDIGIEMTSLGSGSRDEMMEYSNPLKRHSVDRGGRRRHSSASLGGLFVGTGGGGDKEEIQTLKNKIRQMEIKFDQQLEETAQTLRQSAKHATCSNARPSSKAQTRTRTTPKTTTRTAATALLSPSLRRNARAHCHARPPKKRGHTSMPRARSLNLILTTKIGRQGVSAPKKKKERKLRSARRRLATAK